MAAEYETENCVRGYHEYQAIGTSAGETLLIAREPTNVNDRYAVAVLKSGTIIGHLPKEFSLFLWRGGIISCVVTGKRRFSADLPQEGLEIPCKTTPHANQFEHTQTARNHVNVQPFVVALKLHYFILSASKY